MGFMNQLSSLLYGKNFFRYHLVPIVFIIAFTGGVQVLMVWAQGQSLQMSAVLQNLKGDLTSCVITFSFFAWAWLSIRISSKVHFGPETSFGFKPKYADNGFSYFIKTMSIYMIAQYLYPGTSRLLYDNFPKIIGVSNCFSLLFCVWLFIKGKWLKSDMKDVAEDAPWPYEYYRGMELHPRILGVDVKQWTNCRVGMMSWPIFLTAFFIVSIQTYGYSAANFMHFFLQMVYVAKFYWWEAGYFHTLDMMVDRAGYYLCWGCLVFLPAYFCFPASYVITSPPKISDCSAYLIGGIGLFLTFIEYWIDQQKHEFREAWPSKQYKIWGKNAKFILAEYKDGKGHIKKSALLTSGFWGVARHLNYALEIVISFTISATLGFNNGIITFTYFLLIAPLVLHRILRDEAKCSAKYGKDWIRYKREVKYVLIPGVY